MNNYIQIIGIIDTLNDWNEKLNSYASEHLDSVLVGTLILFGLVAVSFWAIGMFSKK